MNANAALSECRRILGAPSRSAVWWGGLTRGEQRLLLFGARLSTARIGAPWHELDRSEQMAIIQTARRASAWAAQLIEEGGHDGR
jgi:hypothetical protein